MLEPIMVPEGQESQANLAEVIGIEDLRRRPGAKEPRCHKTLAWLWEFVDWLRAAQMTVRSCRKRKSHFEPLLKEIREELFQMLGDRVWSSEDFDEDVFAAVICNLGRLHPIEESLVSLRKWKAAIEKRDEEPEAPSPPAISDFELKWLKEIKKKSLERKENFRKVCATAIRLGIIERRGRFHLYFNGRHLGYGTPAAVDMAGDDLDLEAEIRVAVMAAEKRAGAGKGPGASEVKP